MRSMRICKWVCEAQSQDWTVHSQVDEWILWLSPTSSLQLISPVRCGNNKSIPDKASLQPFMMSSASHVEAYPPEIWRDVSNAQHWKARSIMQSSDFIQEGRINSPIPSSHSCSHLSIHLGQCKLFFSCLCHENKYQVNCWYYSANRVLF